MPEEASDKSPSADKRQVTVKKLPFTYFHLSLNTSGARSTKSPALDILTARTYITSALQQYLGLTGTTIPIDVLKHEDTEVWIRVPKEDGDLVQGALSQWASKDRNVSWQIKRRSDDVGSLAVGDGQQLFNG